MGKCIEAFIILNFFFHLLITKEHRMGGQGW